MSSISKSLALCKRKYPSSRLQHGFTLIELLVVIGIIAMLVAILLPTLNKARVIAKRTQCASNMHQCYLGFYLYADDNRGVLPITMNFVATGYWWAEPNASSVLLKYFGNYNYKILYCPAFLDNTTDYTAAAANAGGSEDSMAQYWWETWYDNGYTGGKLLPPPYASGTYRVTGYEFMTNPALSMLGGSNFVMPNPPLPNQPTTYWCRAVNESAKKVLIVDCNEQVGGSWADWAVAHTSFTNRSPQGSNECLLDGSISWVAGGDLRLRYYYYGGSYNLWW